MLQLSIWVNDRDIFGTTKRDGCSINKILADTDNRKDIKYVTVLNR